jgi:hypothetical protein
MMTQRKDPSDDPIEMLIAGEDLAFTEPAYDALIRAYYFLDPELPLEAAARARILLDEWRPLKLAAEQLAGNRSP